jgi:diadenosine tetraphosphatase ApaH/serine/threonine PP2A family protein phosphatase
MKIALVSDVHGNLEALLSVKKSLENEGVDRVLFLGDIVGYGASPNECIDVVRVTAHTVLAGNHDWAAIGKSSTSNFNPLAEAAITWTAEQLTKGNKKFLFSLPLREDREDFLSVHATHLNPEAWAYIVKADDADKSFLHFLQPICFIAHSHYPIIFIQTETGLVVSERASGLTIKAGQRYIINSGSVGQPRDGSPLASYGIYDTEKKTYSLVRVEYDVALAQKKIIAAGLPPFLAKRIGLGR